MSITEILKPVIAADGTVWDGSINLVVGRRIYYGTPRTVNIVEICPVFSANSEIGNLYIVGEEVDVLGWVRGNMYKNDDRYWVSPDGGHIPVYATAEKPV